MKMLFAALTLTFSSAAFAESSHSYYLTCHTQNESVSMTLGSSQVYGVAVGDVVYAEAGRKTPILGFTTDVEMDGKNVPKRFSFYNNNDKLVELTLPADAFTTVAYLFAGENVQAAIAIDGKKKVADCEGGPTL